MKEPPLAAAGRPKKAGARTSTRKRLVNAMPWIIMGSSTPATTVGPRGTVPSGPMIDQVSHGGSRP
jgi:hypothetical protein